MKSRWLGVFLVILVFPSIVLLILVLSTQNLHRSDFYKNLLVSTNSYDKISSLISKSNTNDEFAKVMIKDIGPQWLRNNIEPNLDSLSNFINKKSSNTNLGVDISPFKSDLLKQIPGIIKITIPDRLTFASYKAFINELKDDYINLNTGNKGISDGLANFDQLTQSSSNLENQVNQDLDVIQRGVDYYNVISYIIYSLTILLLIIIAIAARRSISSVFSWIGHAIFWPSLICAIVIASINEVIIRISPLNSIDMSDDIRQLVSPIYDYTVKNVVHNMLFYSIIFTIIGAVFIITAMVLHIILDKKQLEDRPKTPNNGLDSVHG